MTGSSTAPTVEGVSAPVRRLRLRYGADGPTRAEVTFDRHVDPRVTDTRSGWLGQRLDLVVGGQSFRLEVSDCDLPLSSARFGGWMELSDPRARCAPYERAVFSDRGGVAAAALLEEKCGTVSGPAELFAKRFETWVVDVPLLALLEDLCRRHGWHHWWGDQGLTLGPIDQTPAVVQGMEARAVSNGTRYRLDPQKLLPVDCMVEISMQQGVVVSADYEYRHGSSATYHATVGPLPEHRRHFPRTCIEVDGAIRTEKPLEVELTDESFNADYPDRSFIVQAELMERGGDGGNYQEATPLRVGDVVKVLVPVRGVATSFPSVRPESAAPLSHERTTRGNSWSMDFKDRLYVTGTGVDINER